MSRGENKKMNGMSGIPYLGTPIQLISKGGNRYEGSLYTVDPVKGQVALKDVRSFGTEGRSPTGIESPGSDQVYDYIVFRGADIGEITVLSNQAAQPAPRAQPVNTMPQHNTAPFPGFPTNSEAAKSPAKPQPQRTYDWGQNQSVAKARQPAPVAAEPARQASGADKVAGRRRTKKPANRKKNTNYKRSQQTTSEALSAEPVPTGDFDFAEMMQQLEASKQLDEQEKVAIESIPTAYDKSESFFDDISSDSKDKAASANNRLSSAEIRQIRETERQRNANTFFGGNTAVAPSNMSKRRNHRNNGYRRKNRPQNRAMYSNSGNSNQRRAPGKVEGGEA